MTPEEVEKKLKEALYSFDEEVVEKTFKEVINAGVDPITVINKATAALKEIGDKYEKGELFLAHLVAAGVAAKKAIDEHVIPLLKEKGAEGRETLGKVVIGTVQGDIHDIGKNIVASMLFAEGFEVIDLGKDVPVEEFVKAVKEQGANILGMSALLSTTVPVQKEVIEALKKEGIREEVKVMVGGAPVTADWAEEIGADGYAPDATEAVKVAKKLVGKA